MEDQTRFKENDRIRYEGVEYDITAISPSGYYVQKVAYGPDETVVLFISFKYQDDIEKIPYSPLKLKPFQQVLVRDEKDDLWVPSLFGFINLNHPKNYVCLNGYRYKYCVPYNYETGSLLGTDKDYDGCYKTWQDD